MESGKEIIGRHKYNYLKSLEQLTPEQESQVKAYEESKGLTKKHNKQNAEYFERINKPSVKPVFELSKNKLWNAFLGKFKELEGKDFLRNNETLENIKPLVMYFVKDENFISCKNVITKFNFGNTIKESIPSLDKGLLIVGNYGNGKTSIMQVFEKLFVHTPLIFRGYTANNIVEEYEECETPADKTMFWQKMNAKRMYFDDVKTERIASNYGKANLFKDIFEKRYMNKKTTYITCNYHPAKPYDLDAALMEFGEKYGGRVFDRLFEMFNIIEFKGKSFRK